MVKITFFALIILCVVCLVLFATTTLTNGGMVYKTFATHPDTPPSGALLLWAKTDGTFQVTNNGGTDSGMGGGGGGGGGPWVFAINGAAYGTFTGATPITFDTNDKDTSSGAMHSISANTSHFVAPSNGVYYYACTTMFSSASQDYMKIQKNGSTVILVGGGQPANQAVAMSGMVSLVASDYIECLVAPGAPDVPLNSSAFGIWTSMTFAKMF